MLVPWMVSNLTNGPLVLSILLDNPRPICDNLTWAPLNCDHTDGWKILSYKYHFLENFKKSSLQLYNGHFILVAMK